ncbi:MAG: hypothetical protein GX577_07180 [Leptolinea sp.]|nr:hypothetical protein [Leptolinea sp.]
MPDNTYENEIRDHIREKYTGILTPEHMEHHFQNPITFKLAETPLRQMPDIIRNKLDNLEKIHSVPLRERVEKIRKMHFIPFLKFYYWISYNNPFKPVVYFVARKPE